MNEQYLQHHGILGMHWGIRRYQNLDGSYTPAGKKRYGISANSGAVSAKAKLLKMESEAYTEKKIKETEENANRNKKYYSEEDINAINKIYNDKLDARLKDEFGADYKDGKYVGDDPELFEMTIEDIGSDVIKEMYREGVYEKFGSTQKNDKTKNRVEHRDDSQSLSHHGILGMKWGIRRYQNEDGTLTEAGKQRYHTDKKFAEKYDADNAKRQKIANINKRQAGKYTYVSKSADVNNRHHNTLSAIRDTYVGEKTRGIANWAISMKSPSYGRLKEPQGVLKAGRVGAKFAINYLGKKKYEQIAQDYALKEYNDDGTRRVREGSEEHKKLLKERKRKQNAVRWTATALKILSDVAFLAIANKTNVNRGASGRSARQAYDVNGKWANPNKPRGYTYRLG